MSRIAFLGCGSMNEAILSGMIAAGSEPSDIVATVRRAERAAELAERHGVVAIAGSEDPEANREAVRDAAVVILGVKPVGIAALAREIAPV
ncbi:MAG: NAD(P)-binding domain-containing protein, partial [Arthrobacter sp.]|nr:NAD(P)-binding domain-containing protein [Arthrobacter sp.]